MNIDEAKKELPFTGSFNGDVLRVVKKIFNYYDSRICKNCIHLNSFERCTKGVMLGMSINGEYESMNTFGCNKFNNTKELT